MNLDDTGDQHMKCIGISFRTAPLNLRQKLSFSPSEQESILHRLRASCADSQFVLLCTCNRTEVYFESAQMDFPEVVAELAAHAGLDAGALSGYLLFYLGDSAVSHLFKVSAGIDSMVVGEDEILSQTKEAYQRAAEQDTVGYELNRIFQAAFSAAKKIKTETALSKSSVSVATLAARTAAKFTDHTRILVIGGSGKIGSTVLKNLISYKNIHIRATQRRHRTALKLSEQTGIELVDYQDRYRYIEHSDCIISATSSPHYTVTANEVQKAVADGKPRLLIDLAVPSDIEPAAAHLEGIQLINIDDFRRLAFTNNLKKQTSVEDALVIIDEYIDTLKKDLMFHDFRPFLSDVEEKLDSGDFTSLIYHMKARLSAEAFSEFICALKENRQ